MNESPNYHFNMGLVIGLLAGSGIALLVGNPSQRHIADQARAKKLVCEQALPRNQYCVMAYVPKPSRRKPEP